VIAATPSPANQVVADGKENQQVCQAEVSGTVVDPGESPSVSKRPKKSRIKLDSLSQAGNLVRDSCDPHTPIWVPGLSYPAQYCIRQTRSLSQKLQVDNIDCIDLDDCIFGSQRMTTPKVKQEDCGSENGVTAAEVGPKPLRRKSGRRSKRRKQRSKQASQTISDSTGLTDSSDCGISSGDCIEQPVVPIKDVSLCLVQSPTNDKPVLMSQQPLGDNNDMVLSSSQQNNIGIVPSSPGGGNNSISMSVTQQLSGGNNEMTLPVAQDCTEDNNVPSFTQQSPEGDNDIVDGGVMTTPVTQQPLEGENNMSVDNLIQNFNGQPSTNYDKDLTLYGITESMLMSPGMLECGKTAVGSCRFCCEQTDDLHSKVVVFRNDAPASIQHCSLLKVCH